MTYTEWQLTKTADEKSEYEKIQDRLNAGDPAAVKAMGTPTSSELLWHLLGAGLGAGGGYLLSRRLRRNGTKRQRALDVLIGALLGGFGTNVAMNSIKGDSGMTWKNENRADALIRAENRENPEGNDKSDKDKPSIYDPNPVNVSMAAAGVPTGMLLGHWLGPGEGWGRNIAFNRAMSTAQKQALAFGEAGSQGYKDYLNQRAVQQNIADAAARGAKTGHGFDVFFGGVFGGTGGYYAGSKLNEYWHREDE